MLGRDVKIGAVSEPFSLLKNVEFELKPDFLDIQPFSQAKMQKLSGSFGSIAKVEAILNEWLLLAK